MPCAALEFALQYGVEVACVVEAGAVVGNAELLDAGYVTRILNGDGGVVGEDVQECDGVVAEAVGAGSVLGFGAAWSAVSSAAVLALPPIWALHWREPAAPTGSRS